MRVAISTQGKDLDAEVDMRFGRASRFLLVDTSSMTFEVFENNQNLNLAQGAGIQTAQNILEHRPDAVITGNCGPKAFQVLQAAGVQVIVGAQGKIRDVVQAHLDGQSTPASGPNVEGHWS